MQSSPTSGTIHYMDNIIRHSADQSQLSTQAIENVQRMFQDEAGEIIRNLEHMEPGVRKIALATLEKYRKLTPINDAIFSEKAVA